MGDVNKMVFSAGTASDTSPPSSREIDYGFDRDFDGQVLHVCRMGEDGRLNVIVGPGHGTYRTSLDAVFEYISASPDGYARRILFESECPYWHRLGRSRRLVKLGTLLEAATFAWGNDVEITKDPLDSNGIERISEIFEGRRLRADIDPDSCAASGTMVTYGQDDRPPLDRLVPELGDLLAAAASDPDTLYSRMTKFGSSNAVGIPRGFNDLLANGSRRHQIRDALRAMPWLPMMGSGIFSEQSFERTGVLELDHEGIATLISNSPPDMVPAISPSIIAWFDRWVARSRAKAPHMTMAGLSILSCLPASWRPVEHFEMHAFRFLANRILDIMLYDVPDSVSLLMHSKGRFVELYERLRRDVGPDRDVGLALNDVKDFIETASNDLGMVDGTDIYVHAISSERKRSLASATKKLISRDGGIRLFLELSDRWHDVVRAKRRVEGDVEGISLGECWPRAAEDFTTSSGFSVVELLTEGQLIDEGRSQSHCVGGYAKKCAFGGSHVFSIRSDGASSSTVEIRFKDPDPASVYVVQHQGPNRLKPSPVALAALEEWLAAIRDGRLKIDPRPVDRERLAARTVHRVMSIDEWRPFLSKPMADLPEAEFRAEIERIRSAVIEPWLARKGTQGDR